MAKSKLEKLFSNEKFLADYSAWLKDPVTQEVFSAAREMAEPSSLSHPDPNAALYMHGVYVGFNRMLSFFQTADHVLESAKEAAVEESYGEHRVLDSMYPQLSAARKRKQKTTQAPTA
jgi:hypothetical protein